MASYPWIVRRAAWRVRVTQRQIVVRSASSPRSLSNSSTSRNESEYRRYQRTAQRISSGSVCRHLKIAGRIAFFMICSGYPPRRPKLQHNHLHSERYYRTLMAWLFALSATGDCAD